MKPRLTLVILSLICLALVAIYLFVSSTKQINGLVFINSPQKIGLMFSNKIIANLAAPTLLADLTSKNSFNSPNLQ